MSYYYNTKIEDHSFEEVVERTTNALKEEGFGVLTNIDMKATLKNKLDVDIPRYEILGACNPNFAYKALQSEEKIGLMLPCNVIVQEKDGYTEVSVIDPVVSMQGIQNADLEPIADEVQSKLRKVIEAL